MDRKPIAYKINGETIYIYSGIYFTKNELIKRLKDMKFAFVDSDYKKEDLVTLYDIATNYQNNIEKIIDKLRFDNKYFKYRNIEQKRQNLDDEEEDNNNNNSHNSRIRSFFGSINQDNQINNNNNTESNSLSNSSCRSCTGTLGFAVVHDHLSYG